MSIEHLNLRQRNFLDGLVEDCEAKGRKAAHDAVDSAQFTTQALPEIKSIIMELERDDLQDLTLGEIPGNVAIEDLLEFFRDTFFASDFDYVPRDQLGLYDLLADEEIIYDQLRSAYAKGVKDVLKDWVRRSLMRLAERELKKNLSQPQETTRYIDDVRPLIDEASKHELVRDQGYVRANLHHNDQFESWVTKTLTDGELRNLVTAVALDQSISPKEAYEDILQNLRTRLDQLIS